VNEPDVEHGYGVQFWITTAIGFAIMGLGAWQYLDATPDFARRFNFVAFLLGSDVLHDFVLAPVVCAIGWLVARFVPGRVRAPIQFGLMASGILLLLALPGLRRTGATTNNPSIQPLNYATATLTVLAVVWAIASVWLAARLLQKPGRPAQ
jgi:hypothetical protein